VTRSREKWLAPEEGEAYNIESMPNETCQLDNFDFSIAIWIVDV